MAKTDTKPPGRARTRAKKAVAGAPAKPPKGGGAKNRYAPEDVIAALRQTRGMIGLAGTVLGCDWHTVKRYIDEHAEVRAAYDEVLELNLDRAEAGLLASVFSGDRDDRRFYLRTKGRARGYGDRQDVNLSGEVTSRVVPYPAKGDG